MTNPVDCVLYEHQLLGPITMAEHVMMRQVPIGYKQAEWTQERLANVRESISRNPRLADIHPNLQSSLRRQFHLDGPGQVESSVSDRQ